MLEVSAILAAGVWAGAINVIVGSGTLVTFPVLLLFGYPPLVANISNNVGIVAGMRSATSYEMSAIAADLNDVTGCEGEFELPQCFCRIPSDATAGECENTTSTWGTDAGLRIRP